MRITTTLNLGQFQLVALTRASRQLASLDRAPEASTFQKRELSPLLVAVGPRQLAREIQDSIDATRAAHPSRREELERVRRAVEAIANAATALDALRSYYDLVDLPDDSTNAPIHFSADRLQVYVSIEGGGSYTTAIAQMCAAIRAAKRTITASEQAALDIADWKLRTGARLETEHACLGTSGFRGVQTCLSLADPGPDHVRITAWDDRLLHGMVVHVEYIDRDKISDKERIEPYRIPAAWHANRVRLRVGEAAPCTAFIGRPVFENHGGAAVVPVDVFETDLLKTVHFHATACSAMFAAGIADCKIAIERMTAACAVRFMRAVAGNVLRDRDRQTLSAAFNINTPIVEDDGRELRDRYEVARRGIELAIAGGFDKVTWDGASSEVPSKPIIGQLTHAQLVDLVHEAHENGLETYISAGMVASHMADAVACGVDGVGIGTSMHWIDAETKLMGALKPGAVRAALDIRDAAAATPLGAAAKLLARLDQMHFERSLTDAEEAARDQLYRAVRDQDAPGAEAIAGLSRVRELADVSLLDNPIIARGRRRLGRSGAGVGLSQAVAQGDSLTVRELLDQQ